MFSFRFSSNFLLVHFLWVLAVPSSALILPPLDKIKMGMTSMLMEDCEDESEDCNFVWELDVTHGYQVARRVFETLAENGREDSKIWFPSFKNHQGETDRLAKALNENSALLGGLQVNCEHWPEVPATVLELSWSEDQFSEKNYAKESESTVVAAIKNTEDYVNDYISGLGLCPFTQSMERSAIGLENVGVHEGPVGIKHAANLPSCETTTPAAVMAALYWQGVTEIIERPETEVSTFLLIAPSCYDDDFEKFYTTCGSLIEQTTMLAPGSVGRVWFHPKYCLKQVGGEPKGGHAPPISEVEDLFDLYLAENISTARPEREEMEFAHDKTRWTPHATINLLRSTQLKRAKDNKMRAKIFPLNVLRVLANAGKKKLPAFL